jgi:hypothetical protein
MLAMVEVGLWRTRLGDGKQEEVAGGGGDRRGDGAGEAVDVEDRRRARTGGEPEEDVESVEDEPAPRDDKE